MSRQTGNRIFGSQSPPEIDPDEAMNNMVNILPVELQQRIARETLANQSPPEIDADEVINNMRNMLPIELQQRIARGALAIQRRERDELMERLERERRQNYHAEKFRPRRRRDGDDDDYADVPDNLFNQIMNQ